MFKLLVLTTLFATCFANSFIPLLPVGGRIVGGDDAELGDIPAQVVMLRQGSFTCGGSIIRDDVVMTAAHCVSTALPASSYSYRAGSLSYTSGGQILTASAYKLHEDYVGSSTYWDSDIALFLLNGKFTLNDHVGVISLPTQDQDVPANSDALTSGWGRLWENGPISNTLQKVNIPIVDQEVCRTNYQATGGRVSENMICAGVLATGGKGPCNGDSGGPLIVDNKVVGITSWSAGCTRPNFPTVFARVTKFVNWIHSSVVVMELRRRDAGITPSDIFNAL